MSDKSAIEWTDATWNPTTGCTKVSAGCEHCYIDRTPLFRIGVPKPRNDGAPIPPRSFDGESIGAKTGVLLHPERLDQPLSWKRPRRIFVNSLSDLFHDDVPDEFITQVFAVMSLAHWHTFQVLTKRPRRMQALLNDQAWRHNVHRFQSRFAHRALVASWPLPNVWLGTSVEDQKAADLRIPLLLETPAAVRFLSCEPLLGPVELYESHRGHRRDLVSEYTYICLDCSTEDNEVEWVDETPPPVDWVIVGGESGPGARPMHPDWARSLRDQCVAAGVPFFFKQWGNWCHPSQIPGDIDGSGAFVDDFVNVGKKKAGRELDGRTWDEMPERVS